MTAPQRPPNRFARILRHAWWDERDAERALDNAALARVEQRVADSERRHGGEIRVVVESGLPLSYLWRGATARERAVTLFGKLRVWDTEQNNGVLVYLLLAEHCIEIVADRGLDRRVDPAEWAALLEAMRAAFRRGEFEAGLNDAIDRVDALLTQRFGVTPGSVNPNELPDAPLRR